MESKGAAFITGAAIGIGRAIALRLADDGYDIAVNSRSSSKEKIDSLAHEIRQKGRKAISLIGDVSIEADVQKMVADVVQHLGGLDVMVANAGIYRFSPLVDTTVEDWDFIHSVNGRGVFLCYKHAARQMIKQGRGGRIIGASSMAAKQAAHACGYSSSKHAVTGLTQAAAGELGQYGITVNAYAPGPIETEMLRNSAELSGDREAFYNMLTKNCPMGQIGQVDDVASMVSYLASKEAKFITGQTVSINGGTFFD